MSYLHGDTHGVAEVDDDECDDGEPLLLGEGGHGAGAGVPFLSAAAVFSCAARITSASLQLTAGLSVDLNNWMIFNLMNSKTQS